MKRLVFVMLIICYLSGCSAENKQSKASLDPTVVAKLGTHEWEQWYKTDDYSKYTTLASINGLDGAMLQITGIIDSENQNGDLYSYIITSDDNKWLFLSQTHEDLNLGVGDTVSVYGIYLGCSGEYNDLPSIIANRVLSKNGSYEAVKNGVHFGKYYEGRSFDDIHSELHKDDVSIETKEATVAPTPAPTLEAQDITENEKPDSKTKLERVVLETKSNGYGTFKANEDIPLGDYTVRSDIPCSFSLIDKGFNIKVNTGLDGSELSLKSDDYSDELDVKIEDEDCVYVISTNSEKATLTFIEKQFTEPTSETTTEPTDEPTTAPTAKPTIESKSESESVTVYVTKTGAKYHRDGCRSLSKSKIAIDLSEARRKYEPCDACDPPR